MKRRPLFWKLYPSFVLISFVSLLAVTIIACLSFKTFHYQQRELDLEVRAKLIKEEFAHLIQNEKFEEIQDRAEKLGEDSNTRITIILPCVIAIDTNERILRINSSACQILDITKIEVQGMAVQEVIRNAELAKARIVFIETRYGYWTGN